MLLLLLPVVVVVVGDNDGLCIIDRRAVTRLFLLGVSLQVAVGR